jgi:hypothetical protein
MSMKAKPIFLVAKSLLECAARMESDRRRQAFQGDILLG